MNHSSRIKVRNIFDPTFSRRGYKRASTPSDQRRYCAILLADNAPLLYAVEAINPNASGCDPRVRIHGEQGIEFRVEAFNAFNHANFGNPTTTFGSANFGKISSLQSVAFITD